MDREQLARVRAFFDPFTLFVRFPLRTSPLAKPTDIAKENASVRAVSGAFR
jgi:hypothetical protein